jgi:antirestriction protein ArdC
MLNFITGHEYTGANTAALEAAGYSDDDKFVTFKQALKIDGISGKGLKGIKSAATLIRFSKDNVEEDEDGNLKPRPIFFSVFELNDVLNRKVVV